MEVIGLMHKSNASVYKGKRGELIGIVECMADIIIYQRKKKLQRNVSI